MRQLSHYIFRFLQLPPEEVEPFATVYKHAPLKKQVIVM